MLVAIVTQSGIYQIKNLVTNKVYIGSTVRFSGRWRKHKWQLSTGVHRNTKLLNSWKKHGAESFEFSVLERVQRSLLLEREQFWLDSIKPFGSVGYNIQVTAGSNLGLALSEEHKRKIGLANKGRKKTPEQIEAIRKDSLSRGPHSLEHRLKISEAGKGRVIPQDLRDRMSKARLGRPMSEDAKRKMSAAKLGKTWTSAQRESQRLHMEQRVISDETRERLSAAGKLGVAARRLAKEKAREMIYAKQVWCHTEGQGRLF